MLAKIIFILYLLLRNNLHAGVRNNIMVSAEYLLCAGSHFKNFIYTNLTFCKSKLRMMPLGRSFSVLVLSGNWICGRFPIEYMIILTCLVMITQCVCVCVCPNFPYFGGFICQNILFFIK